MASVSSVSVEEAAVDVAGTEYEYVIAVVDPIPIAAPELLELEFLAGVTLKELPSWLTSK